MTLTLVAIFVIGYVAIAMEHPIKVDKTASALVLGVALWIVYSLNAALFVPAVSGEELAAYVGRTPGLADEGLAHQALQYVLNVQLVESLGDICQTLLFLIGAMTIVELIDVHGGFSIITDRIVTRRKSRLMWTVCAVTFILSAILDNLTTTIVMLMLLRKLVADQKERWIYASMIVIAANTGGAWSPIGDVTTIMLWVKGNVTAPALIRLVLLPSIVACLVPLLIASRWLKGDLAPLKHTSQKSHTGVTDRERKSIFWLGVGGLVFVPVFKTLTHMPPFVGILLVLGLLWIYTELLYNGKMTDRAQQHRLPRVIARIDMPSILFFLGILLAVAVLQHTGILAATAAWLDATVGNVYVIDTLLGLFSSVVDNVPLVAASMGMYEIAPAGNFMIDGTFWLFLSYCAGVGGSMLIIGSAAGVIAMGLEKISFGWYLKRFTLLALAGYLAGAAVYIAWASLFG